MRPGPFPAARTSRDRRRWARRGRLVAAGQHIAPEGAARLGRGSRVSSRDLELEAYGKRTIDRSLFYLCVSVCKFVLC